MDSENLRPDQLFAQIKQKFTRLIADASDVQGLEEVRIGLLGKKGELSQHMRLLASLQDAEKKAFGQGLNTLKSQLSTQIESRKAQLQDQELTKKLAKEGLDLSLPMPYQSAKLHPVMQVMEELIEIFSGLGFRVAEGPDVDNDFNNFTALNFPADHPARDMHDTFFLKQDPNSDLPPPLLRTHTSTVQIRTMMQEKPPLRIIAPGRTYRCDSDQTHTPMFHQIEGLVIDKNTHMGHLKGCLNDFISAFFETDVHTRFRPHHFPFTEPSAEMDIGYHKNGAQIVIGGSSGGDKLKQEMSWMEILGCGMVHPNVLRNCGLDPDEYQGFAFGLGVDRLAMLKYGIPDLRDMFHSDTRWLEHFGFSPLHHPSRVMGLS